MTLNKPLLTSVLLGLVFVVLINVYLSNQKNELLRDTTPVQVVVAVRDIPEGTRLQSSLLEIVEIPKRFLQPDVAKSVEELVDRQVSVSVLAGTQILGSMLAVNQNIGLSQKIDKGFFAVTVPVNTSSGVAGLLQPGDAVDVFVTVEVVDAVSNKKTSQDSGGFSGPEKTEMVSHRVLDGIKILAVDRRSYRSETGTVDTATNQAGSRFLGANGGSSNGLESAIETVTLAVTDIQSPKLTLAKEIGVISLALHSSWNDSSDTEQAKPQKIGADELLGIERTIIPPSADIYYGGRRGSR